MITNYIYIYWINVIISNIFIDGSSDDSGKDDTPDSDSGGGKLLCGG